MASSASQSPAPDRRLTVGEYLALEGESVLRHEFVAGERYAMTGGTLRHNRVTTNVLRCLDAAAAGGPCCVYISDVKVRVGEDRVYYPDVVVCCGPVDEHASVVEDPCLVVEITSTTTRRVDRGEKLAAYRTVPSLRAYLVVEQGARVVERHWRDASGAWSHAVVTAGDVPIPCPSTSLPLDDVYRDVGLDAPPPAGSERPRPRRVREPATP